MGGKYRILYTKKEKKEGRENGKCRYKIVSIKNDEKKIIIIRRVGEVVNTLVLLNKIDYLVYAALM